jgi:hypothetical protein
MQFQQKQRLLAEVQAGRILSNLQQQMIVN